MYDRLSQGFTVQFGEIFASTGFAIVVKLKLKMLERLLELIVINHATPPIANVGG